MDELQNKTDEINKLQKEWISLAPLRHKDHDLNLSSSNPSHFSSPA
jgi:hypothetical protein